MILNPSNIRRQILTFLLVVLSILSSFLAVGYSCQAENSDQIVGPSGGQEEVPPANHIAGPLSVIVILVCFKDVTNTLTRDDVKNFVFTEVNNYVKQVSYNTTWLSGNVTSQWYRLSRSRSYYGAGEASSERAVDLIVDAVRAADREINYMNYGYVMVVYAGDNQDMSGKLSDPSSWGTYGSGYPISTSEGILGFGVTWLAETDPIGTYAHYFSRNLRLPDLWNHGGNPVTDDFVAEWDLMGHGFWANNGSTPVELTSWSRIRLGWMPESEVLNINASESRTIDITQIETSIEATKVVRLPISEYTYYLIEVRRKVGYDLYLPDEGVLVLYVNEMLEDGQGIVRVVDSSPLTPTLNDAALKVGGVFENRTAGIALEVISSSNSSCTIFVDRSGQPLSAYLTVDIPHQDIQVVIDGANLTPDARNQVQKLVRVGSHVVEVPSSVYIDESSRTIFSGWTDGDLSNPRTVTVNGNATITANYKMQNLLQLVSPYSSPTGSGWYDTGTIATFSIPEVVDHGNGTRRVFSSWRGDSNTSSPNGQVEMDQPHLVYAEWKTQHKIEFTSTGLENGTAITLSTNGRFTNLTVPFDYAEWFDENSEVNFQISPESYTSGFATSRLEGWINTDQNGVTSPLVVTHPQTLTALYLEKRLLDLPPIDSHSTIGTTFWSAYPKVASNVLNQLSRYTILFRVFIVVAAPFFLIMNFAYEIYLTFASAASAVGSIVLASLLLSLVYLLPIAFIIIALYRWKYKKVPRMRMLLPVAGLWVLGLILVVSGAFVPATAMERIGLVGVGALAVATGILSALIPPIGIISLTNPKGNKRFAEKTIVAKQVDPKQREEDSNRVE
jgi:M6 family metalloprotease-like protein